MRRRQIKHLLEGRDQIEAVKRGRAARPHLAGPQGADLVKGEIIDPPVIARAFNVATISEFRMIRDIGAVGEIAVMTHDEDAVRGQDQVGFDDVGALFDGKGIGFDRVFGQFPICAAMRDHLCGLARQGLPDIGLRLGGGVRLGAPGERDDY